jgi:hypothetical protein
MESQSLVSDEIRARLEAERNRGGPFEGRFEDTIGPKSVTDGAVDQAQF